MKKIFIVILSFAISLLLVSCSSTKEIESIPVEERFARAKVLFDNEDYLEAIEEFKIVTVQFQGSDFGDDAQFYLAECRFNRGEFILASAEYDNLVRLMPAISAGTNFCIWSRSVEGAFFSASNFCILGSTCVAVFTCGSAFVFSSAFLSSLQEIKMNIAIRQMDITLFMCL